MLVTTLSRIIPTPGMERLLDLEGTPGTTGTYIAVVWVAWMLVSSPGRISGVSAGSVNPRGALQGGQCLSCPGAKPFICEGGPRVRRGDQQLLLTNDVWTLCEQCLCITEASQHPWEADTITPLLQMLFVWAVDQL